MPSDQTAPQLPFMEGSSSAQFRQHAEQKTVGGPHTIPVMTGEQATERPSDSVVSVLLPGPERIKAAQRAVDRGADGVFGGFGKSNRAGTSLRVLHGFTVVGFEQNHSLSIAPDESRAPIESLPFDATATVLGEGGLMGDLAFPHPSPDEPSSRIGGIPGGSPEQEPVPTGALEQRHVVAIPTPCQLQAVVQALKLAAE